MTYEKKNSVDIAFEQIMKLYYTDRESFTTRALCSIRTIVENLPSSNGILSMNTYGYLEVGIGGKIEEYEVITSVMPAEISLRNTSASTDRSLGVDELTPEQLRKLLIDIVGNVKQAHYDQYLMNMPRTDCSPGGAAPCSPEVKKAWS
jgi:hypothetical protein